MEQISVFLENRAGQLALLLQCLAQADINIHALSLADTSDFGILRLIVSDQEKARTIIREHGFTVGLTIVVAMELKDAPGSLYSALNLLSTNGINVEYMYACSCRKADSVIMIFRFDKVEEAIELLSSHHFKLLDSNEVLCQPDLAQG